MQRTDTVLTEVSRWQVMPAEFWLVTIFFAVAVVFACFTSRVAAAKGYSAGNWFAGGFFFGLVALIAAAGLPNRAGFKGGPFSEAIICDACGYFGRSKQEKEIVTCPLCGSDRLIPADSPRGRKLIEELHSEKAH